MPATGDGAVAVPKPGAPLPVEKIGVVELPKIPWITSASRLLASIPSLSVVEVP